MRQFKHLRLEARPQAECEQPLRVSCDSIGSVATRDMADTAHFWENIAPQSAACFLLAIHCFLCDVFLNGQATWQQKWNSGTLSNCYGL